MPSQSVPDDAVKVSGIDFNQFAGKDISAADLVAGMATMGFQATSIGQAAQMINEMVRIWNPLLVHV